MLLSAVIIILREVLEASLLVSLLLLLGNYLRLTRAWLLVAIAAGVGGAVLLALNLQTVSEWFEYTGQEILDSILLSMVYLLWLAIILVGGRLASLQQQPQRLRSLVCLLMIAVVAVAITREGAEIYIYLSGFANAPEKIGAVYVGSLIGFAIGASAGSLFYYSLALLNMPWRLKLPLYFSGFLAAAAASQVVPLLEQIDKLPSSGQLWDSSKLIDEQGLLGQLLYAVAGYEATPSKVQGLVYLTSLVVALFLATIASSAKPGQPGEQQHSSKTANPRQQQNPGEQ